MGTIRGVGELPSSPVGSAALESSIASSTEPRALERNHVIVDQGEICCNGQWWVCCVCCWCLGRLSSFELGAGGWGLALDSEYRCCYKYSSALCG